MKDERDETSEGGKDELDEPGLAVPESLLPHEPY